MGISFFLGGGVSDSSGEVRGEQQVDFLHWRPQPQLLGDDEIDHFPGVFRTVAGQIRVENLRGTKEEDKEVWAK